MAVSYASVSGIKCFIAPIVFASIYLLLFACFLAKAVAGPVYIHIVVASFCAVRIAAFILRALLARVLSDAENLHVFISYEILYNTGFFVLLYAADYLVTARARLVNDPPKGPISSLLRLPMLFLFALFAAITLSITGAIMSSLGITQSTVICGNIFRKVSIYVFLSCSVLVFLRAWFLPSAKLSATSHRDRIGYTYGTCVLFVISTLLLVREVFFAATANNTSRQNNEAFWYPFSVATELIAIVLFTTPGLVPPPNND